jgi:hypothetical protein
MQTINYETTALSTTTTHVLYYTNFAINSLLLFELNSPNKATYTLSVNTIERDYDTATLSETYTLYSSGTTCTPLDNNVILSDIGPSHSRIVRLTCEDSSSASQTVKVVLELEWLSGSFKRSKRSSLLYFDLPCAPIMKKPSFSVINSSIFGIKLTISSDCPTTCADGQGQGQGQGHFKVYNANELLLKELTCSEATETQTIALMSSAVTVCVYHPSFPKSPLCSSKSVSIPSVELLSLTATPQRATFEQDPSRTITAVISMSTLSSYSVESVFLTEYSGVILSLVSCGDGQCTFSASYVFEQGVYSFTLSLAVEGNTILFSSTTVSFSCESIGTMSIVSAASPNYKLDRFDVDGKLGNGNFTAQTSFPSYLLC